MVRDENGSALIWFVFLIVLLSLIVLTLASSIHQYLFARELIDFTEQFAISIKTRMQLGAGSSVSSLAATLISEVAPKYSFESLELKQISLESGETVKVIFCAKWSSPVTTFDASRRICEIALAR